MRMPSTFTYLYGILLRTFPQFPHKLSGKASHCKLWVECYASLDDIKRFKAAQQFSL
jgi:hypothetical protein